jgi:SAM-dependent methyltransferase
LLAATQHVWIKVWPRAGREGRETASETHRVLREQGFSITYHHLPTARSWRVDTEDRLLDVLAEATDGCHRPLLHAHATRFGLPGGYRQRSRPDYFSDDADDGIIWQPDVYPYAAAVAKRLGRDAIIDVGCGHAGKLAALAATEPDWQYIGVDYGPNIRWCNANLRFGRWIEADLETCRELPIPSDLLRRAVIVCSDVLEHLVRPDTALEVIRTLTSAGGGLAILSTPAREYRAGVTCIEEPRNPAHVREWTSEEFRYFITTSGLTINDFQLTRSDDRDGGLTTQLVTVEPTSGASR